jgi:hypothetical protein
MHRFSEILDDITRDLLRDTPEFITVIAPEQGGKTTFALQAISHFGPSAEQVLTLYLNLSFLAGTDDESEFVAGLPAALDDSLSKSADAIEPTLRADLVKFLRASKPRTLDELRRILRELCDRLPNRVVLLICDEFDKLSVEVRSSFLRFLRAVHATRKASSLAKFSVMLLATTRPQEVHLGEISPFNVASEYELPDLDYSEVRNFIGSCPILNWKLGQTQSGGSDISRGWAQKLRQARVTATR